MWIRFFCRTADMLLIIICAQTNTCLMLHQNFIDATLVVYQTITQRKVKENLLKNIMSFRRPNGHVEQMSRCFDWIDFKKTCYWRMCLIPVIISGWKVKTFVRRHVKKEILNFEFYQLQLFFADRCVNVKVISTKGDWDRNMGQRIA